MNSNWNISGLILEGISGTGKTALLSALIKSERFIERSFLSSIVLSEHQTQRVLEKKDRDLGLLISDNLELLNQHVTNLENLQNPLNQMQWCRNNQINMRIPYILERFHFTHVYHYDHMEWKNVQEIDSRLSHLNCKLCIFTVDERELEQRLFTGRDSAWNNYIKRYGDSNREILEYFLKQQNELIDLAAESQLDTLIVNTGELNIEETLEQVLDFWGAV